MPENEREALWATPIDGADLHVWNERWEFIERGFFEIQPPLRYYVGLFAAKMGGEFKYIAKAANLGSGLSGGLSRAYVSNPSGDDGRGMQTLRKHRNEVDAYVIKLPKVEKSLEIAKDLKKAMLKAYDPEWNQSKRIVDAAREKTYAKKRSA